MVMGQKWIATLKVEFEMEDGRPDGLAKMVLLREVGQFRNNIERGLGIAPTGVKANSAKVEIVSEGPG
jgi:hypothetical protein